MMIKILHVLFAITSAWRITEIITMDRISEPFRRRFPWYIWSCPRCVSVWASALATAFFVFFPWANWPLGIAWLYIWQLDMATAWRRAKEPPKMIIMQKKDGSLAITHSDFPPTSFKSIGDEIMKLAPQ